MYFRLLYTGLLTSKEMPIGINVANLSDKKYSSKGKAKSLLTFKLFFGNIS